MICPKCGAAIPDDSIFCEICGEPTGLQFGEEPEAVETDIETSDQADTVEDLLADLPDDRGDIKVEIVEEDEAEDADAFAEDAEEDFDEPVEEAEEYEAAGEPEEYDEPDEPEEPEGPRFYREEDVVTVDASDKDFWQAFEDIEPKEESDEPEPVEDDYESRPYGETMKIRYDEDGEAPANEYEYEEDGEYEDEFDDDEGPDIQTAVWPPAGEESRSDQIKEELKERVDLLGEQTKAAAEKVEAVGPVIMEKTEAVRAKAGKLWSKLQDKLNGDDDDEEIPADEEAVEEAVVENAEEAEELSAGENDVENGAVGGVETAAEEALETAAEEAPETVADEAPAEDAADDSRATKGGDGIEMPSFEVEWPPKGYPGPTKSADAVYEDVEEAERRELFPEDYAEKDETEEVPGEVEEASEEVEEVTEEAPAEESVAEEEYEEPVAEEAVEEEPAPRRMVFPWPPRPEQPAEEISAETSAFEEDSAEKPVESEDLEAEKAEISAETDAFEEDSAEKPIESEDLEAEEAEISAETGAFEEDSAEKPVESEDLEAEEAEISAETGAFEEDSAEKPVESEDLEAEEAETSAETDAFEEDSAEKPAEAEAPLIEDPEVSAEMQQIDEVSAEAEAPEAPAAEEPVEEVESEAPAAEEPIVAAKAEAPAEKKHADKKKAEKAGKQKKESWLGNIGKSARTGTGWAADSLMDRIKQMKDNRAPSRKMWSEEEEGDLEQDPGFWYRTMPTETRGDGRPVDDPDMAGGIDADGHSPWQWDPETTEETEPVADEAPEAEETTRSAFGNDEDRGFDEASDIEPERDEMTDEAPISPIFSEPDPDRWGEDDEEDTDQEAEPTHPKPWGGADEPMVRETEEEDLHAADGPVQPSAGFGFVPKATAGDEEYSGSRFGADRSEEPEEPEVDEEQEAESEAPEVESEPEFDEPEFEETEVEPEEPEFDEPEVIEEPETEPEPEFGEPTVETDEPEVDEPEDPKPTYDDSSKLWATTLYGRHGEDGDESSYRGIEDDPVSYSALGATRSSRSSKGMKKRKQSDKSEKKKSGRGLKIGIIAAVIALILVGGGFLLNNKGDSTPTQKDAYQTTLTQAEKYAAAGDFENAEATYQKLIEEFPNQKQPYEDLANLYIEEKKYDQAERTINKGVQAVGENETFTELTAKVEALTSTDWKEPYRRVVAENEWAIRMYDEQEGESTALCDVTGDNIPELFFFTLESYGYGKLHIYTCIDKEAQEIEYECKNRSTQYQDAFYDIGADDTGYIIYKDKKTGRFGTYANFLHAGVNEWQTINVFEKDEETDFRQVKLLESRVATYGGDEVVDSEYLLNDGDIDYDRYVKEYNRVLNSIDRVILSHKGSGDDREIWSRTKGQEELGTTYDGIMEELDVDAN